MQGIWDCYKEGSEHRAQSKGPSEEDLYADDTDPKDLYISIDKTNEKAPLGGFGGKKIKE
jgi:hypothetical protein